MNEDTPPAPPAVSGLAAEASAWMTPDGMSCMTPDEKEGMAASRCEEDASYALRHDVALVPATLASQPTSASASPIAAVGEDALDTKRLDWLLPNVHPATFGMDFRGGYEWEDDAEYLTKWREAIDSEIADTAARARSDGLAGGGV